MKTSEAVGDDRYQLGTVVLVKTPDKVIDGQLEHVAIITKISGTPKRSEQDNDREDAGMVSVTVFPSGVAARTYTMVPHHANEEHLVGGDTTTWRFTDEPENEGEDSYQGDLGKDVDTGETTGGE